MPSTKVLLVVPANNTSMAPEMRALCPTVDRLDVARVARPPRMLTVDDLPAYGETTLASIEPFITSPPDLVVYGCTAAGFLAGPEGNRRIVDAIATRMAAGSPQGSRHAPVISTAESMIEVLRHGGVASTTLVTPYLEAVNDGLRRYLEASGIAVETLSTFACQTTDELGRLTQAQVMERAFATVTPATTSLFIACSQLPTLDVIEPLRQRLGIPVWSSIGATAWMALRALSRSPTGRGAEEIRA